MVAAATVVLAAVATVIEIKAFAAVVEIVPLDCTLHVLSHRRDLLFTELAGLLDERVRAPWELGADFTCYWYVQACGFARIEPLTYPIKNRSRLGQE